MFLHWLEKEKELGISGIGIFTLVRQPATTTRLGRDFEPPRHQILFKEGTSKLQLQDLLMQHGGLSPEQANLEAQVYAGVILQSLEEQGFYEFTGAGKLIRNENQLRFEPFADEALGFGLSGFSAEIVAQPAATHQAVMNRKRRRIRVFPVIVLLLIAAAITFHFAFPEQASDIEQSVLSVFDRTEEPIAENTSESPSETDTSKTITEPPAEQNETDTVVGKEKVVANTFFIIGGSFTTKEEAQDLQKRLISRGFPSEILESPSEGRIRVSYQGYSNKNDALKDLDALRVSENKPDLWLYTKK